MSLAPGFRLGPYDVTALIGEGGMGQVYRATDAKLKREVALKVLPADVANDRERLARFRREAEVLASLNHPHIAQIYGLEEASGVTALVLELVEGPTLAEKLGATGTPGATAATGGVRAIGTGHGLPLDEALPIAKQIAEALEAAHEQGIIHRDLKPGITGRRAFPGDDITDAIVSVVSKEPDWSALPAETPAGLRRLLARCLRKDPKARMQAIGDVRVQIDDWLSGAPDEMGTAGPSAGSPAPASASRPAWSRALPWAVAAALAGGLGLSQWARWRGGDLPDRPLVRLDVDLGAAVSLPAPEGRGSSIAISPDGTRLVYVSGAGRTGGPLFTRRLDQPVATELPGTRGAAVPLFSPDGQWIAFFSSRQLHKTSVEGGAVLPLGEIGPSMGGASWGEDGGIVVSESMGGTTLLRMYASGGAPEQIASPADGEAAFVRPQFLPGGRAILMVVARQPEVDTIEVLTLADGRRTIVARDGESPRYLPTYGDSGHLVYLNRSILFAIPFDPTTLETHGTAVPVLNDVAHSRFGNGEFDVSRTGTLVYRRASDDAALTTTLQWVDPTGTETPLGATPGAHLDPGLSPDGARVAIRVIEGAGSDIWVYDTRRKAMTRLTFGGGLYRNPLWTPDGRYVVFSSGNGLMQARADGGNPPQALTESSVTAVPWSFTADGARLAYHERRQIWTVPVAHQGGMLKAGTPEAVVVSRFRDVFPAFSPDGRWLAYQSDESGRPEVFVRSFPPAAPGQGGRWQISTGGGQQPRWSRRGRELVYGWGEQIMAVQYRVNGDAFVAEKPRVWIARSGAAEISDAVTWDLAPDGTRVAVVAPADAVQAPRRDHHVVFLLNFFDELRRRVPLPL